MVGFDVRKLWQSCHWPETRKSLKRGEGRAISLDTKKGKLTRNTPRGGRLTRDRQPLRQYLAAISYRHTYVRELKKAFGILFITIRKDESG